MGPWRFSGRLLRLSCGIAGLLACQLSMAITIELFKDGKFIPDYEDKLMDLQYLFDDLQESDGTGKVFLKFGDESPIEIMGPLGSGKQALILEIGGNRILRLPLKAKEEYRQELSDNFQASTLISKQDATIPIVHYESNKDIQSGHPPQYLIGEKINVKFTFEQFWNDIINRKSLAEKSPKYKLGQCEIQKIMLKLVELAKSTADFTFIGDVHKGNLAYDGGKWVILDYGLPLKTFDYGEMDLAHLSDSILDQEIIAKSYLPKDVVRILKNELAQSRLANYSVLAPSCDLDKGKLALDVSYEGLAKEVEKVLQAVCQ